MTSRRRQATSCPKSVTYALAINTLLAAITLASTVVAYVVKVMIGGELLRANAFTIFLNLGAIYALAVLLIALLVHRYIDDLMEAVERTSRDKSPDAFFSKDFLLLAIRSIALSSIACGMVLFLYVMYGLARFVFPSLG